MSVETGSHCVAWPGAHCVDQAGFKLTEIPLPASSSQVLGLKTCHDVMTTSIAYVLLLFFSFLVRQDFSM